MLVKRKTHVTNVAFFTKHTTDLKEKVAKLEIFTHHFGEQGPEFNYMSYFAQMAQKAEVGFDEMINGWWREHGVVVVRRQVGGDVPNADASREEEQEGNGARWQIDENAGEE